MKRAVGAVVLVGMICLGSILGDRMVRVRPSGPDAIGLFPRGDSLSALTSVAVPAKASLPHVPTPPPASFLTDPLVFLSRAPADSLDLLPGIGPVLAGRIVEARRVRGGFASWSDVDAVKGIGPRMIARWRALSRQ